MVVGTNRKMLEQGIFAQNLRGGGGTVVVDFRYFSFLFLIFPFRLFFFFFFVSLLVVH